MTAQTTLEKIETFDSRNTSKGRGRSVKRLGFFRYNNMEKSFRFGMFAATEDDLEQANRIYDRIPTPEFFPSFDDLKHLRSLLPNADIEKFQCFRAKSKSGTCACGRNLSVYDIVLHALDTRIHTPEFLADMLNGDLGNVVICGADGPQHLKAQMPATTVWIENITSVPCSTCGTQHYLFLSTPEMLHHWVLALA